jgi:hypothetical protein
MQSPKKRRDNAVKSGIACKTMRRSIGEETMRYAE